MERDIKVKHYEEIIKNLGFRTEAKPEDLEAVREILTSSGFFSEEEVKIAVELVSERLIKGEKSGYNFFFAELYGKTIGYTCFGRIPGTISSYDLYWISVREEYRRMGVGSILLIKTEELISSMGGSRIYIETSSRNLYYATRSFYNKFGYKQEAILKDFYAPGDDKIIFVKIILKQDLK